MPTERTRPARQIAHRFRHHVESRLLRPGRAAYAGLRIRSVHPALPVLVSAADEMYDGYQADTYFRVGADALHWIRQSLLVAGRPDPECILDLPCGHGRVLRWLRAEWPAAAITACDLNRDAVDWCVATMGARPCYGHEDLSTVDLGGPYDLIWVGSLLTHLDAPRWSVVLGSLAGALATDGLLVVSTHGQQAAERARTSSYGLDPAERAGLLHAWSTTGFGYADYPGDEEYGISLSSPAWVEAVITEIPELAVRTSWIAGWDHHQDVFACQRVAGAGTAPVREASRR
ncbi:MAG: class I SAM-dependent methyltransferase [Actinomycetota bacterium]|nr:class I SAM-dependent methyltransferase [Actinomycetota bacterium]